MKLSLKWINDYVDVMDFFSEPHKLGEILTNAGLEVEDINDFGQQFANVVVGHILEKGQHPDADKLSLCQVSTGHGVVHQIVCGASNHRQGDRVVVSLPGAVLPGNFAIKKSKIRGVESHGMLCSEVELGLAEESDGILILPVDAEIGKSFAEYMGLDDVVIELSVTPNRSDCLSHFGLAREIACLLGRELKNPGGQLKLSDASSKNKIQLQVKDQNCSRYAGRYVSDVKVGPSPDWLKRRLERVGMNSINNVVDVTNFVMLELGQPLHAFDADQLAGQKIEVNLSQAGEKFISFDGTEVALTGQELMIRDGDKPVALAGVVGGVNSGVTEETKNLFVESAYFNMGSVRKTARKFGIETESGYRFSRGVDPEGTVLAMDRACELILQVAGGEALADHHDFYPVPIRPAGISIKTEFVAQKLGFAVSDEKFENWMQRLGCEVIKHSVGEYLVTPPPFRHDLSAAVDLVEEYGRLEGYDKIPEALPNFNYQPSLHDTGYTLGKAVRKIWQGLGYQQAINYAFVSDVAQRELIAPSFDWKKLGLNCQAAAVRIVNPLSEDLNVMRTSLLTGLVKNLSHNDRRDNHWGRVFEEGYAFSGNTEEGYYQERRLGLVAWGEAPGLWKNPAQLIFQLKADVEAFLHSLNSKAWRWQQLNEGEAPSSFHPGQCASLFFEGKTVGYIATLHPQILETYKIRSSAVVAELNLDLLLKGQPRRPKSVTPPKFPAIERDLAFLVPKTLPVDQVMTEMKKAGGKLLQDVSVFDVFEGDKVPEGQRSIGFRLVYQNAEETMSDEQVQSLQEKVINSVSQKYSIPIR